MKPQDLKLNVDIGAIVQSTEGPSARISNATYSRLWSLAVEAVNAIKADALDEAADAYGGDLYPENWLRRRAEGLRAEGDTQ